MWENVFTFQQSRRLKVLNMITALFSYKITLYTLVYVILMRNDVTLMRKDAILMREDVIFTVSYLIKTLGIKHQSFNVSQYPLN